MVITSFHTKLLYVSWECNNFCKLHCFLQWHYWLASAKSAITIWVVTAIADSMHKRKSKQMEHTMVTKRHGGRYSYCEREFFSLSIAKFLNTIDVFENRRWQTWGVLQLYAAWSTVGWHCTTHFPTPTSSTICSSGPKMPASCNKNSDRSTNNWARRFEK